MENKNKPAVQTAKNPAKSFFSALNAKRRKLSLTLTMMLSTMMLTAASAFADDTSGGGGGSGEAEAMFDKTIVFFADWIGRVGLVVAFVGAVMFGFSVKSDDPEGKQRGLTTMVAGFIVFAVTKSLNLFGITTSPV